ncbi:hypothetical protein KY326_01405 [Candidatus Woesearchaeota archaeon]|nr:hypothetical protein [Candidatus Woesearchaeota archaeon]
MKDFREADAEQKVAESAKKCKFGFLEILVGAAGVAESLTIMAIDPFENMISTPGIEHYVGGIANGILAYGVGAAGALVLLKGLYDVVEFGLEWRNRRRQLELVRQNSDKDKEKRYGGRPSKSKPIYDPNALDQLRTKKKPPFNPLLF